jgi:tetratricopeptide (TPR) repeat protein
VSTVPDYELLQRIDAGAYGEVWLARNNATGVLRAAKIVRRRSFKDERPFQREFEGMQKFERISREHPSQLALFHVGRNEAEEYFYYVMELADDLGERSGGLLEPRSEASGPNNEHSTTPLLHDPASYVPHTLRADLGNGRLPAERVLEIGLALAEALGHLHGNGLVHRDVKPSNVIFVKCRPKLADIGLVTDASDQCSIVGTVGYLPPEGPGTPQADIFALGKVLYEAVTGMDRRRFPDFPADMKEWPKSEAKLALELNEIVVKACAFNTRERYSGAPAMLSDLQLLQTGRSVKRARAFERYRLIAIQAAFVIAGLGALALMVGLLKRGPAVTDLHPDGPDSPNYRANAECGKGLAIIREDNYAQLGEAYAHFTNAIALDPNFGRPYVGLVEMALREWDQGRAFPLTDPDAIRSDATARLRKLAPDLGATYVALGIDSFYNLDFPNAERYVLQGIELSPNYELGHTWYAAMLSYWGRAGEPRAEQEIKKSLELAPGKAVIYQVVGHMYYSRRDFTNAIRWYQMAIELGTHHAAPFLWKGRAQWALSSYAQAFDTLEMAATNNILNTSIEVAVRQRFERLRQAFTNDGPRGYWEQALNEAERQSGSFYGKAYAQIHIGKTNDALDSLELAFKKGPPRDLTYLLFDESWDVLRKEQRFRDLLDKIGYTKVMRPQKR